MNNLTVVFAVLAALLHVLIFGMESLWFMRPAVHRRFGAATPADAEARRLFAFNQGFYNLLLAVEVLLGLGLLWGGDAAAGRALLLFGCASMVVAGCVLLCSGGRRMLRAAIVQACFPLLAWAAWLALG